ncbi:MAG TPA: polysaccharide biosynthesis tyrosine autokinase [Pedobacter sp.]|nr:polysaccharide biosynthesis tyrosine autokinase [Pedobacter sp.]
MKVQHNALSANHLITLKSISYIRILRIIVSRWYWLTGILVSGLTIASAYIYIKQPLYLSTASFKVEEKRTELTELISARAIYERSGKIESERFILQSKNVLYKALSSLDYDVSFYRKEKLRLNNIYPEKPLDIKLIHGNIDTSSHFEFIPINKSAYQLKSSASGKKKHGIYRYGQVVSIEKLKFKILSSTTATGLGIVFTFNNKEKLMQEIKSKLSIDEVQNGNIIGLRISDENPYFAKDILNAILNQYLNFDKSLRSSSIMQSETFISSLLLKMSARIKSSGDEIQKFKRANGLLNPSFTLTDITSRLTDFESQKHALNLNARTLSQFKKNIDESMGKEDLSYGLQAFADPQLNTMITNRNQLIIKKQHLSNFYTFNAPEIKRINSEITVYSQAIHQDISSQIQNNQSALTILDYEIDSIRQNLEDLPFIEQQFINLQSKFDVDQKIYNYLSEKKLEAQISRESIVPGAVIIDSASISYEPIAPVPQKIYTASILISMITGIALTLLLRIWDPYIHSKEIIEEYTKTPVIGIIGKYNSTEDKHVIPVLNNPRSHFSETVKSVRSRLNFLASEKKNKIICVTSEISGEGKSFVSLNLAASLSLTDKRILLIDTDMRKPALHRSFKIDSKNGLSQYLSSQLPLNQLIKQTHISNLDFIPSGEIPPNPSELLHNNKMSLLLNTLESKYDFIVLDSAPIGLVSDSRPLMKIADINLFVLRCGVSKQNFATSADTLEKEMNLTNFGIILNDYMADGFHSSYYDQKQYNGSGYHRDHEQRTYNKEYFQS